METETHRKETRDWVPSTVWRRAELVDCCSEVLGERRRLPAGRARVSEKKVCERPESMIGGEVWGARAGLVCAESSKAASYA